MPKRLTAGNFSAAAPRGRASQRGAAMLRPMRASSLLLALAACSACSARQAAAPPVTPARPALAAPATATAAASAPPPAPVAAPAAPPAPAPPNRQLAARATYGDLVRAAALRVAAHDADSAAGCLLATAGKGYSLQADLMPALDPLPDAPTELDDRLQRERGPVRVLTGWGPLGDDGATLALVAFTTLPPSALHAPALSLWLTDEGVYLRSGSAPAGAGDGPLQPRAAIARALAMPGTADGVLYVTAEAAAPMAELIALLRALPAERLVALALALPAGTRLPASTAQAAPQDCPGGLPPPPEQSSEGTLDPHAIVAALGPLRAQAEACLRNAQGRARAGGRLVLALRIEADGRAGAACLRDDPIGDPALAACVIAAARGLRFPIPNPPGFVDVHLPLALTPEGPPAQHGVCEPSR